MNEAKGAFGLRDALQSLRAVRHFRTRIDISMSAVLVRPKLWTSVAASQTPGSRSDL